MLAEEPLFACEFNLSFFLGGFVISVTQIKVLFPSYKIFNCDRSECCKFGSLKHLHFFVQINLIDLIKLPFNKIDIDPVPCFFNNIKNNWFVITISDDFLDLLGDVVNVVPGDAGNGLNLVFN